MTRATAHATAENTDSQKSGKPVATSATPEPTTRIAMVPTAAGWATMRSRRWRWGLSRVLGGTSVCTANGYPSVGSPNRCSSAPDGEQLVGGGERGDERQRVLEHSIGVLAGHAGHRVAGDDDLVAEVERGQRHAEHTEVHRHAGGDDGPHAEVAQDLVERR